VPENDDPSAIEVTIATDTPDLGLIDALARLQLEARRCGTSINVRPCEALRELILLAGLAEVLAVEPRRETEQRVELGIQEVVEPDDPTV
jgi:hypothetical protein